MNALVEARERSLIGVASEGATWGRRIRHEASSNIVPLRTGQQILGDMACRNSDILITYIFFFKGPFADSTVGSIHSRFLDAAGSDQNWFKSVETANERGWTRLLE